MRVNSLNGLRHIKALLNIDYWRGFSFFIFNDGVPMDILEAKKNLKKLHEDKEKIESLNHLNAPIAFKFECDWRIRQIDGNIETIKQNIKRYGR